jgi:hypothetical protein
MIGVHAAHADRLHLFVDVSRRWPLMQHNPLNWQEAPFRVEDIEPNLERQKLRTMTLVPADSPTAVAVEDPAAAERVREHLHLGRPISDQPNAIPSGEHLERFVEVNVNQRGDLSAMVQISLDLNKTLTSDPLHLDLACDLILRSDETEVKIATLEHRSGSLSTGYGFLASMPLSFNEPMADVILRPSLEAAEGTVDTVEFLDAELVFEDVPIIWIRFDPEERRYIAFDPAEIPALMASRAE